MKLVNKLGLLIIILISIFIWFYLPIEYLIKFTSDDSYFYLKTALIFAQKGVSSFDCINLTNGYHPLWFLLVSFTYGFCLLLGISGEDFLLRITFVVTSVINLLSLFFVKRIIREIIGQTNKFSLIITFLLLIPFVLFYLVGLEVQIFVLTLIITIYLFLKFLKHDNNKSLIIYLSFSISLIFLSRVDLFWYVFVAIFLFIFIYKRERIIEILKISVIPFLTFLTYVIINRVYFQTYYPISSYYKLSFNVFENLKFFPLPFGDPINFSILTMIFFFTVFYYFNRANLKLKNVEVVKLIEWLNIAFINFLIMNFLINSNGAREWYYSFPMFTSIILFALSLKSKKYVAILLLLSTIFNLFYFFLFRANYYNHNSAFEFAKKIKNIIPKKAKIYQVDYSGLISFFSGKQIINGDGLVNSFNYYKSIKAGDLEGYLKSTKPDYFVFYSFTNPKVKDYFVYNFEVLRSYEIRIPNENLIAMEPFLYGGIFRRKIGYFYLLKFDGYEILHY